MSTNCNGAEIVYKKRASSESSLEDHTSGLGAPETFPPDYKFRGYVPIPHVRLERFNITPYLNGKKQNSLKDNLKIGGKEVEAHMKKISQKCIVKLRNDNLGQLKASLQAASLNLTLNYDSDTNSVDMKCKICDKVYNSERKLLNHQQNKHIIYKSDKKPRKKVSFSDHVIVHEVEEYHKCRKCPKIFEDYNSLRAHSKHEHKKRKCYICNYCQKKFVDRMFFKVHIRLHCDVCGKLLPNKAKYVDHKRNVCRVLKLHKCKTCDEVFFKIMDLKDHSYEHDNLLYVCDICKDHFTNKCEIGHHIAFLHSPPKQRPKDLYSMLKVGTERLYLCNFCDESSVEKDIIENHVQTLPDLMNKVTTGYKDYYFCDQCMKKFDTEKSMLQHKWTHFLKAPLKSILTRRPEIKTRYHITEKIPKSLQPVLRLEKIDMSMYVDRLDLNGDRYDVNDSLGYNYSYTVDSSDALQTVDVNTLKKKAVVDPKSKKTLISKHQCQTCEKYFSTNYCLNRHVESQHGDFESLRCKVCEEIFVWPSLLRTHKCIRLNHPEMPFDDARPEIHFDNAFDNLNIQESEDYMNRVDFEIPAPAVELRECDSTYMSDLQNSFVESDSVSSSGYRLVMQEVPIEF